MILPTKHIRPERALLTIGADILACLDRPLTVSRVWDDLRKERGEPVGVAPITYDWFVLALDLLFMLKAVTFENGLLRKATP
ncbi:ABC-three component system middle component 6 [Jannaschia marina]|uniref:ABC-three component system middle component 6 n=1 Tax=Jannaschia marina TaxID=2741674 RepID=UPI0015CA3B7E|nr:ABC-three component system middle component 6 [Jannaschia marina]